MVVSIITKTYVVILFILILAPGLIMVFIIFGTSDPKKHNYLKEILVDPDTSVIQLQLIDKERMKKKRTISMNIIKGIVLDKEVRSYGYHESSNFMIIIWHLYLLLIDGPPVLIIKKKISEMHNKQSQINLAELDIKQICEKITSLIQSINPRVKFRVATRRDEMVHYVLIDQKLKKIRNGRLLIPTATFFLGLLIGVPFLLTVAIYPEILVILKESGIFLVALFLVFLIGSGSIYYHDKHNTDNEW